MRKILGLLLSLLFIMLSIIPIPASAAGNVPLCVFYYGGFGDTVKARFIDTKPAFLILNTPGGSYQDLITRPTEADIDDLQAVGIKVISYINTGGMVNFKYAYDSPASDRTFVRGCVDNVSAEGCDGVFFDEGGVGTVADPPDGSYTPCHADRYLTAPALDCNGDGNSWSGYTIEDYSDYCQSKGMLAILGTDYNEIEYLSQNVFDIFDYVLTDEVWPEKWGYEPVNNEIGYEDQIWVIGTGETSAATAAEYSNTALDNGYTYTYQCSSYGTLASWYEDYVDMVEFESQDIIPPPDEAESIISIRIFKDMVETGDVSITFHWDLPYADNGTYPDTPASQSIMFQLVDTDNTTILSTAEPYVYAPFQTNGYGKGVSAFYFNAADNLTWGQAYNIRVVQNPTYFTSPTSIQQTISGTDYSSATTQAESREEMKEYYLDLCDLLLAEYDINLSTSTDTGIVLSTYGESYFRAAVAGIQMLCPTLFYVQDYSPVEMTVTPYDSTLQNTYSLRMATSEIKRGSDRLMAHFGLTGYFFMGLLILVGCIISGIFTTKKGWGLEPGLIGASIISIGGAVLMGNAVFTMVMIIALVATMAIGFTYFGRRA